MVLFVGKCQHGLVGPTCIECYRLALADAQVDCAQLASLRDKLLLQIEDLRKSQQREFRSGLEMNSLAAKATEERDRMRADLQVALLQIEGVKKIIHESVVNYRGASIQVAFTEDARARLADIHKALLEIEAEVLAVFATTEKRVDERK